MPAPISSHREGLITAALSLAAAEGDGGWEAAVAVLCAHAVRFAGAVEAPGVGSYSVRPRRACIECRRIQPIAAHHLCWACYQRTRRNRRAA